ncbi:hypothetical protein CERSUDRAFT_101191 [Gelatoporia subvermispora B]|uniref:Uncharacterized protein n=1 Tax=Ceriporiopsis subvermispora (strain B) TaxID=914234 RepID=M2QVQ3_CERS8|nr:hypothetical protein CERSUDRAFT_101191 [Gelatoporia subvermispora B]
MDCRTEEGLDRGLGSNGTEQNAGAENAVSSVPAIASPGARPKFSGRTLRSVRFRHTLRPGMGQSSLDPLTVNGGQPVDSGLTAV